MIRSMVIYARWSRLCCIAVVLADRMMIFGT